MLGRRNAPGPPNVLPPKTGPGAKPGVPPGALAEPKKPPLLKPPKPGLKILVPQPPLEYPPPEPVQEGDPLLFATRRSAAVFSRVASVF